MICDQCSKKHTRCNRVQPTCYRCAQAGYVCTWERAYNQPKNQSFERVLMNLAWKKASRVNKKLTEVRTSKAFSQHSKDKEFIATYIWNNVSKKWLLKPSYKIIFNITIKIWGINLRFPSKQEEELIYNSLLSYYPPRSTSPIVPSCIIYKDSEILDKIRLSVDAYFYYFNSYWPLMTYCQFVSKPRSNILKLAISTTGLYFLPRSSLRDTLIKRNSIQLRASLAPSGCKFNLDTVQALLVYAIFLILNFETGRANSLINLAAILLSGLGLKSKNQKLETVLARRFTANLESTFLHYLYYYREEDLVCYQHNLKSFLLNQSLSLRLTNWQTTLTIPTTYPLELHQHVKLEPFVLLIVSEANTLILKKPKDLSNQLSDLSNHELSDILISVNNAIIDLNSTYYHLISTLSKFLTTIATFIHQHQNHVDIQVILNDLTVGLDLNSIFHNFKINFCFSILQVLDVIPGQQYNHKPSLPLLRPITLQSLFYASQLVRLIHQIDPNFPSVLQRPRSVIFAYRVIYFHSRFLPSFKSIAFQLASSMLRPCHQIPHLAQLIKGIQQAIENCTKP